MTSNKSLRGTGNLLQDLLSSVVRLKKCDKQVISTNSVKSEFKIKLQFLHCFICGVKHQRRPLSEVKVEILREIILQESFPELISTTSICPLCSTTLEKLIDLRKKVGEISACIRSLIKLRQSLADLEEGLESESPNNNRTVNNEDVKCESDASDYDFVPIDDLPFPVVEELKASEGNKVDEGAVNLVGGCETVNNLLQKVIVGKQELAVKEIDDEDDDVDIEDFVQYKAEGESEELVTIRAGDVVPEPSGGLQIAKVKNENGEEVKLFTNLDYVYDIMVTHESIIPESIPPSLENLTCPECNVTFNKSWKLNRHLRNPWLTRSPQENKKRSRRISNDDAEADLQNDAKRPRLSRIRAEKLIKNITKRDKLNKDDFDPRDDSDFHASSDRSDEAESSSDDDSIYGEDNNNLSRAGLNFDDTEICTESGRYKCLKCNTTYSSKDHLRRHLDTTSAHTGGIPRPRTGIPTQNEIASLTCTVCATIFDDVATLTTHKDQYKKKCEICDLTFSRNARLLRHLASQKHAVALRCRRFNEDGVVTFSCDQCDHGFPDSFRLLQHREAIHMQVLLDVPLQEEIVTLQCKICKKKFPDLATLVTHKAAHNKTCEVCNLTFYGPPELRHHLKTKTHQLAVLARRVDSEGKVGFVCDRCPQVEPFPNHPELIDHRKKCHPGEIVFIEGTTGVKSCLPCDKVFHSVKNYKNHLLSKRHTDTIGATESLALDFACKQCDKKFAANFQLTAHLAYAHNPGFVCEMCGMRCHDLAGLTAHQKMHVNPPILRRIPPENKRYPCKFCDKRFAQSGGRLKHINSVHKGKRYKCDVCQKIYSTPQALTIHKKKHVHSLENSEPRPPRTRRKSQPSKCEICLQSKARSNDIIHIELVHFQDKSKCPYGCSDLEFETEQEWTQHLEGCTSEKITDASQCYCFYCGALFRNQLLRLSHHMQAHQTFSCEICSKVFTRQQSLIVHTTSHQEAKPHLCPKCGKRFRQAWNLKLHLTLICGDDEEARQKLLEKRKAQYKSFRAKKMNFKCDECSEGFVSERRLELHKKKVHDKDASGEEDESDTDS